MLKKDILKLCILHLLLQQDIYGYEILKLLHKHFPDIQETVIYAYLRELLKENAVAVYSGDVSGGPPRKYYHITKCGQELQKTLLQEWRLLTEALMELGIRS